MSKRKGAITAKVAAGMLGVTEDAAVKMANRGMPLTSEGDIRAWAAKNRGGARAPSAGTSTAGTGEASMGMIAQVEARTIAARQFADDAAKRAAEGLHGDPEEAKKLADISRNAAAALLLQERALRQAKLDAEQLAPVVSCVEYAGKLVAEILKELEGLPATACDKANPDNPGRAYKAIEAAVAEVRAKISKGSK